MERPDLKTLRFIQTDLKNVEKAIKENRLTDAESIISSINTWIKDWADILIKLEK